MPSASARVRAMPSASAARAGERPGAGAMVSARMWSRCRFSTAGQQASVPSRPRAAMTDSSRAKST